jgi:F0F1-type ATP synthase, gamma subunit
MAGAREIRTKIKSVANTRKVTRALEMVSASKIRKAQDLMRASRPYTKAMRQVMGHVAKANSNSSTRSLPASAQIKRVGYIIVSTDRGLCGGLNSNMFRQLLAEMRAGRKRTSRSTSSRSAARRRRFSAG